MCQGFSILDKIIHQDNKSTIFMESNGKSSSSKRTSHINIRYFFVRDRIEKGETPIKYCDTQGMIADFFTKPLQGNLFTKYLNYIMNNKSEVDASLMESSELQTSVLGNETIIMDHRQDKTDKNTHMLKIEKPRCTNVAGFQL
jgi:hypothetical protein